MKTLKDLTDEIRAKIPEYKKRCTQDFYSGVEYENFDRKKSAEYVEKIYTISGFAKPVVIFAKNPTEYKKLFAILKQEKAQEIISLVFQIKNNKLKPDKKIVQTLQSELASLAKSDLDMEDVKPTSHWLSECSAYSRAYFMWYKFIMDEFKIAVPDKLRETLNYFYENSLNGIGRGYFCKGYALILRAPKYIRRNDTGFHCITGPAIEWEDYGLYYLNGRKIEKELFEKVCDDRLTFKEFSSFKNEEDKASVVTLIKERGGSEKLLEFLGAKCIDSQTIVHSSGHTEEVKLFKTKQKFSFLQDRNGNRNQPYAWTQFICPSTGQTYLLDTSADFTNVLDAVKFHRPTKVPFDLPYEFELFNN